MIDASTSAEPKKESKVVWVVLLLPPGMSPLKIIAPEIPIPSLVREIKDEFKNMKVMKKKDDFEEPIKSKSKGKKQNNVGEVEKMKVNEKEIKSVNDTIRDVPYEECSAFINQSSSLQTGRTGVEGEGEGEGGGSYWVCQLPVDRIALILSEIVEISHPRSVSSISATDAIHTALKGPLTVLTNRAYGTILHFIAEQHFCLLP